MFKTTIDDIVQDIAAKIEKLHVVAAAHAAAVDVHNAEIAARTKLALAAQAEFSRATRIAQKFTELLS